MGAFHYKRLPQHIGIIPDGNRRWAVNKGMPKQKGYMHGIGPGLALSKMCIELGIRELTFYGFTLDNTKRPAAQTEAFRQACVDAVRELQEGDVEILVVGNSDSPIFPRELLPYKKRRKFGEGLIKINLLVNYGWNWDLNHIADKSPRISAFAAIASSEIPRIDLVIRWGGRCRLSGFLPIQSVYSDIYTVDTLWPDFTPQDFYTALEWFQHQDVTLGG